jgi:eukaryotic translation initiation factor 2C
MTGSIDPLATRYAAVACNQAHRTETIADVEEMTKTLLHAHKRATNILPERIIYLRDGVAEGQYAGIIEVELNAIRRAVKAMIPPNKHVQITVIIVRKRHHTRFFPRPNEGDRNNNVLPGTVVDTDVTHPVEFDFCIQPLGHY